MDFYVNEMLKARIEPNCNHLISDYMWGAILTVPVSIQNMFYSLSDEHLTVGTHVPLILKLTGTRKSPPAGRSRKFLVESVTAVSEINEPASHYELLFSLVSVAMPLKLFKCKCQ